jgi:hypothetical protein
MFLHSRAEEKSGVNCTHLDTYLFLGKLLGFVPNRNMGSCCGKLGPRVVVLGVVRNL